MSEGKILEGLLQKCLNVSFEFLLRHNAAQTLDNFSVFYEKERRNPVDPELRWDDPILVDIEPGYPRTPGIFRDESIDRGDELTAVRAAG